MSHQFKVEPFEATVRGLNGVGRQVALQLVALGCARLLLVDAGLVPAADCLPDGYAAEDVGRPRRHAAAEQCHRLNPALAVTTATRISWRSMSPTGVLFCCAGGRRQRQALLRMLSAGVQYYIDLQAAGTMVRVLTAHDAASRRKCAWRLAEYAATHDVPALHVTAFAAGMAVHVLASLLAGRPVPARFTFDLRSLS